MKARIKKVSEEHWVTYDDLRKDDEWMKICIHVDEPPPPPPPPPEFKMALPKDEW